MNYAWEGAYNLVQRILFKKVVEFMRYLSLRWLFALVLAVAALSGCSSVPVAKDGEPLKSDKGLLAFHVTSNADAGLSYLDFSKESTFGSRFGELMVGPKGQFRIKAGETFHVVPMDAGEYMFSRFDVYPRFVWLQATNRFRVKANTITYIGHIRVRVVNDRLNLQAMDNEFDMRTHLAESYPNYFKAMGFERSIAELRLR
jgi:hypothetical protein